uniref:cardiolipin synthase (CMP-forming) n=1 Tax=Oncorhynchus kisutch TaxID=8019 RepID=A0A8C7G2W8_ONCKI
RGFQCCRSAMRSVCWSTASWRQQTCVCVRAALKRLQRLKQNTLCRPATHPTGHEYPNPVDPKGYRPLYTRSLSRTRLRLYRVRSGVPPGWRGLCNGRPANNTPGEDLGETTRGCSILITEQHFHLSLGLFTLAGFTDVVCTPPATGPVGSLLGSALDPLTDKILISVFYISLPYTQLIPALVIVRDVDLIAAVSYVRYKTVPPPVSHTHIAVQLKPTTLSKVHTAIQLFLVAASLASSVFHFRQSAPADPTVIHTP